MSPLRVAVVGLNNQGEDHVLAALDAPSARLVGLCDIDPQLCLDWARQDEVPRDVKVFTRLEEAAADPEVDALVIALPHHLHLDAVNFAVRCGKHLLKEKPLGRNLGEAQQLSGAMRTAGLVMHTGVQRRCHPTYVELRSRLRDADVVAANIEIGVVLRGDPMHDGWRGSLEKAGGGVLVDLGFHGLDLMAWLLGPLEVVSSTLNYLDRPCPVDRPETRARLWAMAGSAWVSLDFRRGETKVERVRVQTEEEIWVADRGRVLRLADGEEHVVFEAPSSWRQTQCEQMEAFCRAVLGGGQSPADTAEQLPTLRVINDCYARQRGDGLRWE